jgi:hypothetical protein
MVVGKPIYTGPYPSLGIYVSDTTCGSTCVGNDTRRSVTTRDARSLQPQKREALTDGYV